MRKSFTQSKKGFAMLFTVLIISIILALALGIADTTFKQSILSSLARNSQIAFYQADSGVECGMYYSLNVGQFPLGTDVGTAPDTITCGTATETKDVTNSYQDYLVYTAQTINNSPCFSIIFDKATTPGTATVSSRGYSTCAITAQQVERGLSVSY